MLLLLLGVAALSHLTDADYTSTVNISTCPINIYGKEYESIHVSNYEGSAYLCFEGFKGPALNNTCLRILNNQTTGVDVSLQEDVLTSQNVANMPQVVQGSSPCQISVNVNDSTTIVSITLRTFGGTFGYLSTSRPQDDQVSIVLEINSETFESVTLDSKDVKSVMLLAGCRDQGEAYKPGASCLADSTLAICNATINDVAIKPCELCENGACLLTAVCTVTSNRILDISEQGSTLISDRCGYTLLSQNDLELSAVFKDRRRKDFYLLDHLVLYLGPTDIEIGRGSFKLNGSSVNASTAQMPEGISISKTPTEVTLRYDQKFDLSFDGYSALIFLRGLNMFSGLCMDGLTVVKSSKSSSSGCEVSHQDVPDNTINCNLATEHCRLLNGSLFAPCHDYIDPDLLIEACINTTCQYPSADGIQCSFLEAYDALCLEKNVTLPDWRTTAQCGRYVGVCQDSYCSDHEFCGVTPNGEACLCRALFASQYNNTLGEPTVCSSNSASLTMVGCLLNEKNIKSSDLHLKDPSCKGQMDPETHMLSFEFDSVNLCGAEVTNENNQMIFKNAVQLKNQTGMITRHDQFQVDFSCFYSQPQVKTVALKIRDSSVVQRIVSGAWSYNLTMTAFLDFTRTKPITPNTELQLDQTIWVQLSAAGLDHSLVSMVTDSCWATSHPQFNSTPKYDLIQNGCPNVRDSSVRTYGNGAGISNYFSFNMFQFKGESADVYLHCKVVLCSARNNACPPVCSSGARRRRSIHGDLNPGLITLSWAN